MICWDRLGDGAVRGVFGTDEVVLLRRCATGVRALLVAGPGGTTADDVRRGDDPSRQRRPVVAQTLLFKVEVVLATLPAQGGVVELLSFDQVFAWLWVLNDLKVLVGELGEFREDESHDLVTWLEEVLEALHEVAIEQVEPVEEHLAESVNEACGPAVP